LHHPEISAIDGLVNKAPDQALSGVRGDLSGDESKGPGQ